MNGISQIETRLKLTSHGDGAGSNFQFEIDWWRNFYGAKLASTEPLVPPPKCFKRANSANLNAFTKLTLIKILQKIASDSKVYSFTFRH